MQPALDVSNDLNADNITSSGFTLELCEEKLNEKYFSVQSDMMNQLSTENEITREEFQGLLEAGCIRMNEYMCTRYHDIATKAIFSTLALILDDGHTNLMTRIEEEGPLAEVDLKKALDIEYQSCRLIFGKAVGLWTVPSSVHGNIESKFTEFLELLVHNSNITNEGLKVTNNKRKASNGGSRSQKTTKLQLSTSSSAPSVSSNKNSVAEQRKRAALFRESLSSSSSSKRNLPLVNAPPSAPLPLHAAESFGKKKQKTGVGVGAKVVTKVDTQDERGNNLDPVAIALAEARRKEQIRKDEIAAKLKTQSKGKRAGKKK